MDRFASQSRFVGCSPGKVLGGGGKLGGGKFSRGLTVRGQPSLIGLTSTSPNFLFCHKSGANPSSLSQTPSGQGENKKNSDMQPTRGSRLKKTRLPGALSQVPCAWTGGQLILKGHPVQKRGTQEATTGGLR